MDKKYIFYKDEGSAFERVIKTLNLFYNDIPPNSVKPSNGVMIQEQLDLFKSNYSIVQNALTEFSKSLGSDLIVSSSSQVELAREAQPSSSIDPDSSIGRQRDECQRALNKLAALQFQLRTLRRCVRLLLKENVMGETGIVKIALLIGALRDKLTGIVKEHEINNKEVLFKQLADALQKHHETMSSFLNILFDNQK